MSLAARYRAAVRAYAAAWFAWPHDPAHDPAYEAERRRSSDELASATSAVRAALPDGGRLADPGGTWTVCRKGDDIYALICPERD